MKTKTLVIAASVIGGLIGIGILVNYFLKDEQEAPERKVKNPEPDKNKIMFRPPMQPVNRPPIGRHEIQREHPVQEDLQQNYEPEPQRINSESMPVADEEIMHRPGDDSTFEQREPAPMAYTNSETLLAENAIINAQIQNKKNAGLANLVNPPTGDEFPLRLGSKGPRVERLQVFLLRNYGAGIKVSGIFDEQTEMQLKKRLHMASLDEKTYQRFRMGKHVHEQVIIR